MSASHEPTSEINNQVHILNKAVFGDRDDPRGNPGLIMENVSMRMEQKRTNEILTDGQREFREFRDDAKKALFWLFSLLATGIAASIFAVIFKH